MIEPAVIRVLIVDDHPALREGTAGLLEREPGFEVIGLAGSIAVAESIIDEAEPDVVVLDIRLGPERGLDILAALASEQGPRPAVVVWTAYDLPQYAAYALRAGAAAFVLKTAPTRDLVDAIRDAACGRVVFSVRPERVAASLTERERLLVGFVTEGLSNDEIAASMAIGTRAVESHLSRLYQRFEVQSRAELAVRAVREGWLDIPVS